jgi:hypothetical protein
VVTSANLVDRHGRVYGNRPIQPDEPPSSAPVPDPALPAAQTWLTTQTCQK